MRGANRVTACVLAGLLGAYGLLPLEAQAEGPCGSASVAFRSGPGQVGNLALVPGSGGSPGALGSVFAALIRTNSGTECGLPVVATGVIISLAQTDKLVPSFGCGHDPGTLLVGPTFFQFRSQPSGVGFYPFQIPPDPTLCGTVVSMQGVLAMIDSGSSIFDLAFTRAMDVTIGM